MMSSPAISVIMLTYNREQYVGKTIESVLCQTFDRFEFVIVDNGSTDRSGAIADGYAARDARIRVIHKEKGNIGSGRNAGLLVSRGEYVAFVDDDDTAEPDFLAFLYDLITKHNADISVCGCWRSIDRVLSSKYIYDKTLVLNTEHAIIELLKREHYNVTFPCKMIRRDILLPPPFSEEGRYDDIATAYRVFAKAEKVVAQGIPQYTFFRHGSNNSAFTTEHWLLRPDILEEYLKVYRERTGYLSEKFPSIRDYVQYTEWSFMISIAEKIERYNIVACDDILAFMICELAKSRDKFLRAPWTQEFEKDWMEKYVRYVS